MRNRWGIEIKRGNWVMATGPRGGRVEGRIVSIDRSSAFAKAYGVQLTLDTGQTIGADDVSQTLGPMTVGAGGVVKQNPKKANPLTRVKVGSRSQRPHQTADGGTSTAPTKRLKTRRRKTAATKTRGVYANPSDAMPAPIWISRERGILVSPSYVGPGEYKMIPTVLDRYEPSAASARNLAEWAAEQFGKHGHPAVVYVVAGVTSVSKSQTKKRSGFTVTTTPGPYSIVYAFKS